MPVAIGIDIGGTAIKLGAVDARGKLLARARLPVDALRQATTGPKPARKISGMPNAAAKKS